MREPGRTSPALLIKEDNMKNTTQAVKGKPCKICGYMTRYMPVSKGYNICEKCYKAIFIDKTMSIDGRRLKK